MSIALSQRQPPIIRASCDTWHGTRPSIPAAGPAERFPRSGFFTRLCLILLTAVQMTGCSDTITQLLEARRLAAELHVKFDQAADASNRAVMADTDEASVAFAHDAEQAKQAVRSDADALAPIVRELHFAEETRLLEEFNRHFAEYQSLDRSLLELAVENTNLKAQKLSFGPAREAADAFQKSLDAMTRAAAPKSRCQIGSLAASAVLAVRQLQVLHAPHIAESDDAAMTNMEKEMAKLEASARAALTTLSSLIEPAARAQLTDALGALDRFKGVQTQIIALSRRNSNVRSLALALGPGRTLTAACDASLNALMSALAKEGLKATR